MLAAGGAFWSDDKHSYADLYVESDSPHDLENQIKLTVNELSRDANQHYYKGEGRKVKKYTVDRRTKTKAVVHVVYESTTGKGKKRTKY